MGYVFKTMASPVGKLTLVATEKGLAAVLWETENPKRVPLSPMVREDDNAWLAEAERQLNEYFAGTRKEFELALDPAGTPFQQRVWGELLRIPYGETRSYGELALNLGDIKAVRAVGAANGKNPLSIIVPCHRVVGSTGKLTGFAGGLDCKAWLLAHESPNGRLFID